jgi:hypothetical protein
VKGEGRTGRARGQSQLAIYELFSSILVEWRVSRSLELYDSKNC